MSQEWKMVPVIATEEMIHAIALGVNRDIPTAEIWAELLACTPVPPAGGEVEVLAEIDRSTDRGVTLTAAGSSPYLDGTQLVDLDHVTRLQAEVVALKHQVEWRWEMAASNEREYTKQLVIANGLQAELTKARERAAYLESVVLEVRGCLERPDVRQPGWEDRCLDQMYEAVPVNQSAPAAKTSECSDCNGSLRATYSDNENGIPVDENCRACAPAAKGDSDD